jgi:hypothetical protein
MRFTIGRREHSRGLNTERLEFSVKSLGFRV